MVKTCVDLDRAMEDGLKPVIVDKCAPPLLIDGGTFRPPPPAKSILKINSDLGAFFCMPAEKPNWWWRMWQWLLLGFEWEDIDDG